MGKRRTAKVSGNAVSRANGVAPGEINTTSPSEGSNLIGHARRELNRVAQRPDGSFDKEQVEVNEHILKIIEIFAKEGHSGFSAGWAAAVINRLLKFKPLTPLLGTDDEWVEVGEGVFQNSRYGCVFKNGKDGEPYDIETRVYNDGGALYQKGGDRQPITFPYSPPMQPEVIPVNALGHRTFKADYLYDADHWEVTIPWSERNTLVEDRDEVFVPYKVRSLVQGPDLWVISIPITFNAEEDDFEDFEDRWFVSEEEAKEALREAQEELRASHAPPPPETAETTPSTSTETPD